MSTLPAHRHWEMKLFPSSDSPECSLPFSRCCKCVRNACVKSRKVVNRASSAPPPCPLSPPWGTVKLVKAHLSYSLTQLFSRSHTIRPSTVCVRFHIWSPDIRQLIASHSVSVSVPLSFCRRTRHTSQELFVNRSFFSEWTFGHELNWFTFLKYLLCSAIVRLWKIPF